MRFKFGAIAIALLLVFAAAGCGKKKSAAKTTTAAPPATTTSASSGGGNTTPTTSSSNTTTSGGSTTPKFALTKDCAQLLSLGQKVSAAVQAASGSGDTADAVAKEVDLFKQLAAAAPSDIRPDFETFAEAFATAATAMQKAKLVPGQTPTAKQLAQLEAAGKAFASPKVQAAEKNLQAWGTTHCGGLTTTG